MTAGGWTASTDAPPALAALAAAERALGQFDLMLGSPRVRALWWPYAVADEAAGLAWSEGLVTSRARVRLLAAQAARGPFGPGDQRGFRLYQTLQALYRRGKPGPKALAAALGGQALTGLGVSAAFHPDPEDRAMVRQHLTRTLWDLRSQRDGRPATVLAADALAQLQDTVEAREHVSTATALCLTRTLAARGPWRTTPPLTLGWEVGPALLTGRRALSERVCEAVERACRRHLRLVETLVHRRRTLLDAAEPTRRDSLLPLAAEALMSEEVLTAGMLQQACRRRRHPISDRTARKLLSELTARGLAVEATGRAHFRVYTFTGNTGNTVPEPVSGADPSIVQPPLARLSTATRDTWRAETSQVDLQQLFDDLEAADARVSTLLTRLRSEPSDQG